MRSFSVKTRITIWLTVMMALLSVFLLVFMLSISSAVISRTAMEQLSQTMKDNVTQVHMENGKLYLDDGFRFYENGVSTLVYNKNGALLAGQLPVSFTAEEAFQKGLTRTVSAGSTRYLVLDLWVPDGWEDGFWVRGLLEAPESRQTTRNLLEVALIALPLFILLAALGGFWIIKKAFQPLTHITAAAAAINEARDLSRRIGLPPGNDEFSRLAAAFDQLFERLERSFEAEKQFTADASHELRTPVSIIKGACEYAEKYDETPEEQKETIAMIHRQSVRMSELISQLLSMTRLDQGTELVEMERLDLGELTRTFCEEQGYNPQRLILECSDGVMVKGDRSLLSRLLRNLVENGFKYGRPEGHVWVSVCRKKGEALLQVRDDGIGIPRDQQEKVWQRFYQVEASRSEGEGAGLGLSMVRQIARLHGGSMTLESVPDVGSSFTLHLPVLEEGSSIHSRFC